MQSLKQFGVFINPYYWRTARLIARSSLSRQYRNSFLGMLWTLLQPLTMVIVYAIVMPIIMRFPVQNYVIYIICTMPLWSFFSNVLTGASNSLLSQGEVLKRCMISSTVLPISDVFKHVYTYAITFLTMYGFIVLLGFHASAYAFLLPLYFVPMIITLMALAVGIAFVAPYIRDIGEVMMVIMNVMMWLSAVPYPISIVPEPLRWVFHWNPFYILLRPVIALVYEQMLPSADDTFRLLALMLLSIALSYAVYRRCRRNFIYYL